MTLTDAGSEGVEEISFKIHLLKNVSDKADTAVVSHIAYMTFTRYNAECYGCSLSTLPSSLSFPALLRCAPV